MNSMTGFGRAELTTRLGTLSCEISGVNNRFLEASVRLPRPFSALEHKVRELVTSRVERGKLYLYVGFDEAQDLPDRYTINETAITAYSRQLEAVRKRLKLAGEIRISDLLAFPEVVKTDEMGYDLDEVWGVLEKVVGKALDGLVRMRKKEGSAMSRDMKLRLKMIRDLNRQIVKDAENVVDRYREKLRSRLAELMPAAEVNEGRVEQEIALIAERSDITEECTRLFSHIQQYEGDLKHQGAVGKRLNFILQEMNREANTIASKTTEAEITRAVISLKEEIERLRELVQNVE